MPNLVEQLKIALKFALKNFSLNFWWFLNNFRAFFKQFCARNNLKYFFAGFISILKRFLNNFSLNSRRFLKHFVAIFKQFWEIYEQISNHSVFLFNFRIFLANFEQFFTKNSLKIYFGHFWMTFEHF